MRLRATPVIPRPRRRQRQKVRLLPWTVALIAAAFKAPRVFPSRDSAGSQKHHHHFFPSASFGFAIEFVLHNPISIFQYAGLCLMLCLGMIGEKSNDHRLGNERRRFLVSLLCSAMTDIALQRLLVLKLRQTPFIDVHICSIPSLSDNAMSPHPVFHEAIGI